MADELLPLVGHNFDGEEQNSDHSDSEEQNENNNHDNQMNQVQDEDSGEQYDKNIPGTHSYLGSDLEEIRGRTIHEDDSYIDLPILSLPGVVLVPGQTLPLNLFQPTSVSMIRNVVEKDKTFGLVTSRYLGSDFTHTLATIGTTAEIFSYKEENDERSGIVTVRVKAMGRQRFEIKESRTTNGVVIAKARILPERILPDALEGAKLRSQEKFNEIKESKKTKRRDRFSSAYLTWWPPWVYKQYDAHYLMDKVKKELQSWNESLKAENMPKDPTDFSFWVAGNLPLDDGLKLHLLRIDCAIQRMRCELSIMQRCTVLCCKDCSLLMANKNDVFSMALEGPLGAYVNPGGYVHETLTLYKAQGLRLTGGPSTENSWFPGYAWTIANCTNCVAHMGWKFTATKRKMVPQKFWGLVRSSLVPALHAGNTDKEEEPTEASWTPLM